MKVSIDIEWISLISEVDQQQESIGMLRAARYPSKAWPASWVRTSVSAAVPLKLEKIKTAFSFISEVQ